MTCSFDTLVDKEPTALLNSAKPLSMNSPVNTRKELAQIAGVSHDTIAKVEKIENGATEGTKQKLRDSKKTPSSPPGRWG